MRETSSASRIHRRTSYPQRERCTDNAVPHAPPPMTAACVKPVFSSSLCTARRTVERVRFQLSVARPVRTQSAPHQRDAPNPAARFRHRVRQPADRSAARRVGPEPASCAIGRGAVRRSIPAPGLHRLEPGGETAQDTPRADLLHTEPTGCEAVPRGGKRPSVLRVAPRAARPRPRSPPRPRAPDDPDRARLRRGNAGSSAGFRDGPSASRPASPVVSSPTAATRSSIGPGKLGRQKLPHGCSSIRRRKPSSASVTVRRRTVSRSPIRRQLAMELRRALHDRQVDGTHGLSPVGLHPAPRFP